MITLLDPTGTPVGSATAGQPGQVVLETAPITTAGTYSLVVSGDAGTTGNYSLQAILNAVYKAASDPINSIGTAYDLPARLPAWAQLRPPTAPVSWAASGRIRAAPTTLATATSVSPELHRHHRNWHADASVLRRRYFLLDSSTLGGFNFSLYGQSYDSLYFSSNGLITFKQGDADFGNQDLSSYPPPRGDLPLWDDLENFKFAALGGLLPG